MELVDRGELVQPGMRVDEYWQAAALAHDYIQALASVYNAQHTGADAYPERTQYSEEKHPQTVVLEWTLEDADVPPTYCRVIACKDGDQMDDDEFASAVKRGLERQGFVGVEVTILS